MQSVLKFFINLIYGDKILIFKLNYLVLDLGDQQNN